MDWEDRLDDWELELELNAQLEGSDWVTLERAATGTGVCRAALRSWYQTGQIPPRLTNGPHGHSGWCRLPWSLPAPRPRRASRRCRPGGSCTCASRRRVAERADRRLRRCPGARAL